MPRKPRSLAEVQKLFPDDERCADFLFDRRWPEGFVCPKCGGRHAYLLKSRWRTYECVDCGRQTSIVAGTIMHRTKLPLHLWFWAAHLMATHSNGISALQVKTQLDVSYKTAWLLEHKLRRAMVDPDRTKLRGFVEVDQAEMPLRTKAHLEGDPEAMGKIIVVGAVEVVRYDTSLRKTLEKKGKKRPPRYRGELSGRCRLIRIASNSAEEIKAFMHANIELGTTVVTDGHGSYDWIDNEALEAIKRTGEAVKPDYVHEPYVVGSMAGHVPLPWIHRVFSLMKRWGLGTYHGLRRQHIDAYLNEFVFRYNRRRLRGLSFDALLGLAAHHAPTTSRDIIGTLPRPRKKPAVRKRPQRRRTAFGLLTGNPSAPKAALNEPGSPG